MAEEFQIIPLSSSKVNPRSDDEEFKPKPPPIHQQKSNKCLVYFLSAFVLTCAVLLIFAQFVLRPTTPSAEIHFIRVENLTFTNTNSSSNSTSPSFSATLWTEFKIKNRSFGRFTYENSTARVMYGPAAVGEAELKGRRVGAKETNFVNVKVSLSSRNVNGGDLSGDLSSGVLNLSWYGEIRGEMDVLKVFKKKRTATVDCNMNLDLAKRSVRDLFCE